MTERDASGKFIKGNSGNPTGRAPREREERYYEIMKSSVTFDKWKRIVEKATDQAMRGDAVARKWLSDYLIGPPIQRSEVTGAEGGALEVIFREVDNGATDTD